MAVGPTAARAWRSAAAFAAALLAYLAASWMLALPGAGGPAAAGAVAGVAAGGVAPGRWTAAGSAALALLAGVLASPPWFHADGVGAALLLATAAVGAGVALAVSAALERGPSRQAVAAGLAVILIAGSMIFLASWEADIPGAVNQGRSLLQTISERPIPGAEWDDGQFYREVVTRMRAGEGYLEAYRAAYHDNGAWGKDPNSALGVRTPVLSVLWSVLPGWPLGTMWALLALGCVALAASPFVTSRAVAPTVGAIGTAALAAYVLGHAMVGWLLFFSEIWAGALAVPALAAVAFAGGVRDGRRWVLVAAGLALLAASVRELMVFLLLAGLVSAWFAPAGRRRFDLIVWGAAIALFAAGWGAHLATAGRIVTPTASEAFFWTRFGGLANLLSGITSSTWQLGPWQVAVVFAVLGIAGAAALPDRQARVFGLTAVCLPLAGFLLVGTDIAVGGTDVVYNYWGGIVMPSLLALAPAALAWVPGVRAARPLAQGTNPGPAASPPVPVDSVAAGAAG